MKAYFPNRKNKKGRMAETKRKRDSKDEVGGGGRKWYRKRSGRGKKGRKEEKTSTSNTRKERKIKKKNKEKMAKRE